MWVFPMYVDEYYIKMEGRLKNLMKIYYRWVLPVSLALMKEHNQMGHWKIWD
jgi:hypothetical protein